MVQRGLMSVLVDQKMLQQSATLQRRKPAGNEKKESAMEARSETEWVLKCCAASG